MPAWAHRQEDYLQSAGTEWWPLLLLEEHMFSILLYYTLLSYTSAPPFLEELGFEISHIECERLLRYMISCMCISEQTAE